MAMTSSFSAGEHKAAAAPAARMSLNDVCINDIMKGQPDFEVLGVPERTTIREALDKMRSTDVLTLAVTDNWDQEYLGLVNVFDLMNHVIGFVKSAPQTPTGASTAPTFEFDVSHFNDKVISALGRSIEGRQVYTFDILDSLKGVMQTFALGVHRVLITDKRRSSKHARILTQTDVAMFLSEHIDDFGVNPDWTITQAGLYEEPGAGVLSMFSTETALQGFNKLALNEVSAIAIIDQHGELVGTLSASDVRGVSDEDLADLGLPVMDYLMKRSRIFNHQVVVRSITTVRSALLKMTDVHIHRVWVVDTNNRPRGVISLSDLIHRFGSTTKSVKLRTL